MGLPAFDVHDLVRVGNHSGTNDDGSSRAAFANAAGTATDPTAVTLTVKKPDGTLLAYGYTPAGADGTLTKESTGRFYFDVAIDVSGIWYWRLRGTGTVETSEEGAFFVKSSHFS
jgi:hypothetical protein